MFSYIINKFKKEEGQAIVEFAIILPILIMILCGIIDFGWFFTNQNIIDNCSRVGARYMSVDPEATEEVVTKINDMAPSNIKDLEIIVSPPNGPVAIGDVKVEVKGYVTPLTPFVSLFFVDGKMPLDSSCTMRVEQ